MRKWELIREAVLESVQTLPAGTRLPTVLDYRAQFSASQHSVCRALDSLERDGLIVKKPRGGIRVAEPSTRHGAHRRLAYVTSHGHSTESRTGRRSHPFFSPLTHTISAAFEASDYEGALYFFPWRGIVGSNSPLERDIEDGALRGLIISSYHLAPRDTAFLQRHGVEAVLIGADMTGTGFPTVEINAVKIGLLASDAVGHTGRQPAALITGRTVESAEQAFLMARETAGQPLGDAYRIHCPANFEDVDQALAEGREAADRLMQSPVLPGVIWVTDDMAAMGVLQALHESDIHVPREVAVVVSTSTACVFTHPVIRVAVNPETAGQLAVNTLLKLIDGGELERRNMYVDPDLLEA